MPLVIGELLVRLEASTEGLQKIQKGMEEVANKAQRAGQTLSIGLTVPLAAIGTAAIRMGMDAVEGENLFTVSMGRMAESARKWSQDLRKELGLNEYQLRQQVGTFNVMFGAMGIGEQASYDMAKGLTQLAYDMSSFFNMQPEAAFEKLTAAMSGQVQPLRQLGIVINETAIEQYALNHGMIKQGEQLSEQGKILARYGTILEQTTVAQGDMARTLDSPANKLRILQEQIKQTSTEFGVALLPAFHKAMEAAKPLVDKLKDAVEWFSNLSPALQENIVKWLALAAAIGPVTLAISQLIKVGGVITGVVGGILPVVNNAIFAFAAWQAGAATLSEALGLAAGKMSFLFGPAGIVLAGISAIALWVKHTNDTIEAERRLQTQHESTAATLRDLRDRYSEISGQMDKLKPDTEEYKKLEAELETVMTNLGTILPDVTTATDNLAEARKRNLEVVDEEIAKEAALAAALERTALQRDQARKQREIENYAVEAQRWRAQGELQLAEQMERLKAKAEADLVQLGQRMALVSEAIRTGDYSKLVAALPPAKTSSTGAGTGIPGIPSGASVAAAKAAGKTPEEVWREIIDGLRQAQKEMAEGIYPEMRMALARGDEWDWKAETAALIEDTIRALYSAGMTPEHNSMQWLVREYTGLVGRAPGQSGDSLGVDLATWQEFFTTDRKATEDYQAERRRLLQDNLRVDLASWAEFYEADRRAVDSHIQQLNDTMRLDLAAWSEFYAFDLQAAEDHQAERKRLAQENLRIDLATWQEFYTLDRAATEAHAQQRNDSLRDSLAAWSDFYATDRQAVADHKRQVDVALRADLGAWAQFYELDRQATEARQAELLRLAQKELQTDLLSWQAFYELDRLAIEEHQRLRNDAARDSLSEWADFYALDQKAVEEHKRQISKEMIVELATWQEFYALDRKATDDYHAELLRLAQKELQVELATWQEFYALDRQATDNYHAELLRLAQKELQIDLLSWADFYALDRQAVEDHRRQRNDAARDNLAEWAGFHELDRKEAEAYQAELLQLTQKELRIDLMSWQAFYELDRQAIEGHIQQRNDAASDSLNAWADFYELDRQAVEAHKRLRNDAIRDSLADWAVFYELDQQAVAARRQQLDQEMRIDLATWQEFYELDRQAAEAYHTELQRQQDRSFRADLLSWQTFYDLERQAIADRKRQLDDAVRLALTDWQAFYELDRQAIAAHKQQLNDSMRDSLADWAEFYALDRQAAQARKAELDQGTRVDLATWSEFYGLDREASEAYQAELLRLARRELQVDLMLWQMFYELDRQAIDAHQRERNDAAADGLAAWAEFYELDRAAAEERLRQLNQELRVDLATWAEFYELDHQAAEDYHAELLRLKQGNLQIDLLTWSEFYEADRKATEEYHTTLLQRLKRQWEEGGLKERVMARMPILNNAVTAAQQAAPGGPEAMAIAVLASLLVDSAQFAALLERINPLLQAAADVVGAFFEPIMPLITVLSSALTPALSVFAHVVGSMGLPIMQALFPVFKGLGLVALGVTIAFGHAWNLLASVINAALGWLGVNLKLIDTGELGEAFRALTAMTWDQAAASEAATHAMYNVPHGFKIAMRRFEVATAEPWSPGGTDAAGASRSMGSGESRGLTAADGGVTVIVKGDVYGYEDFKRKVREAQMTGERSVRLAQYGTVGV